MSNKILLKNGLVICPVSGKAKEKLDILIEGKSIKSIGVDLGEVEGAKTYDLSGKYISPGLIDIHVHLRDPGAPWKETIKTGCEAAVSGGFTRVCCMPNTDPVNDNESVTDYIVKKAKEEAKCKVDPIGSISVGLKGQTLSPMDELASAGCVAFSDDGWPVMNAELMRRALEYSKMIGKPLTVHEEDKNLSRNFSMNESALSFEKGLIGMPSCAEEVMIARDIELARYTKSHVHFCHVSTKRAALLIERAKEDGINVTAETTPHYLSLTEKEVANYDTNAKMSMPLRSEEDVEGLIEALSKGVIDCIATDHAPHEEEVKIIEFDKAAFGIIGLETSVPVIMSLVNQGKLSIERAISAMSTDAAKCFGLSPNSIVEGCEADITVIDPDLEMEFSEDLIYSKSKNSPYLGRKFKGYSLMTIVSGEIVFNRGTNK